MVDGSALLASVFRGLLAAGTWVEGRESNLLDGGAPFYRTYRTLDGGFMAVGALEPQFFAALSNGLGIDPADVADQYDRSRWRAMSARFETEFASRNRAEWVERFSGTDACVSPVWTFSESLGDDHMAARGTFPRDRWHFPAGPGPAILPNACRRYPCSGGLRPRGALAETHRILGGPGIQRGRDRYAPKKESRPLNPGGAMAPHSSSTANVMAERAAIDATVEGKTLVDVFDRNARDHADKAAIHWKEGDIWRHLTWSQYRKAVHEAAAGLISLGVSGGDFVAIMAGNRPEHVIGDLAAVHAGATGVTIYSTLAQTQIQYVAANCGAKVAILEDLSFMKRWEAIKSDLPALTHVILMEGAENYNMVDWVLSWEDLLERGRAALAADPGLVERVAATAKPEGLATLIYTSGTTGVPKGVMVTHRNVMWTAECVRRGTNLSDNPRMVSYLPLAHIAERMSTHYLGVYLAGEVWYCPDIGLVLEYVTKARPTLFVAVPRVWEKFHNRLEARFGEDPKREKLIRNAVAHGESVMRTTQAGKSPGLIDRLKLALFERLIFSKVRHGLGMDATRHRHHRRRPDQPRSDLLLPGDRHPALRVVRDERDHRPGHQQPSRRRKDRKRRSCPSGNRGGSR